MAWDGKKVPDALATAATSAADAAANGAKNAAYLSHLQSQIGASYKRQLFRDDVLVWQATVSGSLPIVGSTIVLPQAATQDSITTADIDTGEWIHYVVKAADASSSPPSSSHKYIATNVDKTGGAGPAFLTDDTSSSGAVVLGAFVLTSPEFDTMEADPDSLSSAYASCMTLQNDFPPGNSAGDSNWAASTWPTSSDFSTSPYGSNVDPIKSGQFEPGVGVTDAGYIVTRRAASGRAGTSFVLWSWTMPPKNQPNATGNWRVQLRDFQAAAKVDALANAWQLIYGPGQVPTYGLNALGGLRVSGLLADYMNNSTVTLFGVSTNPVEARSEASNGGGVSFKNATTSASACLLELNIPDPSFALPASVTPERTIAFAGCCWARLITDTGSGSVPSGLNVGTMLGVDFYDGSGRVGTPGQSRMVKLTTNWKPIVVAFVLPTLPPDDPMSPAEVGAWLAANPPPFT